MKAFLCKFSHCKQNSEVLFFVREMTTAFYRENKGKREQCSYVLLLNCLMLSSIIKEIILKDLNRDRFFLGRGTGENGGRKGVTHRSATVESPKIKPALLTGHLLATSSIGAISSIWETKQANRSQPTSHRHIKQTGHKCYSFTLLCPDKRPCSFVKTIHLRSYFLQ